MTSENSHQVLSGDCIRIHGGMRTHSSQSRPGVGWRWTWRWAAYWTGRKLRMGEEVAGAEDLRENVGR